MKKSSIVIDLLLLGLAIFLGHHLKSQWVRYKSEHALSSLNPKADHKDAAQKPVDKSAGVPNYTAIVDNHLFSGDRNNIIPVEPPPPPPKVLGSKPILMGILGLQEEQFALMISTEKNDSRDYRRIKVGESLNGYMLVKIFDQKVIMKADGSEVEVRLNEPSKLVARDFAPAVSNPNVPNRHSSERVTTIGSEASTQISNPTNPSAATPEGVIPAGTVVGGKKKVLIPTPFGPMESWVDAK